MKVHKNLFWQDALLNFALCLLLLIFPPVATSQELESSWVLFVTDYWEVLISLFCVLIVSVLILAIICNPSFRKDVLAGNNEANILGFSISGAIIIVLYIPVILGALYPLIKGFDEDDYIEISKVPEYARSIDFIKKSEVLEYVKNMSPYSNQAKKIRDYQKKKIGPWSTLPEAEELVVTVPGTVPEPWYVEKGEASVCEEHFGNQYTLSSVDHVGQTVKVTANKYILYASNCSKKYDFHMQISCFDAELIFTSKMLTCEDGNPRWKNDAPKDRRLSLFAILIPGKQEKGNAQEHSDYQFLPIEN